MKQFLLLALCAGLCFRALAQLSGTLDPSFDFDGKVVTSLSHYADGINCMQILSSGRILVAGSARINTNQDIALAAYTPSGSLDSAFGINGYTLTDFGNNEQANKMIMQADGKIILTGTIVWPGNSNGKWFIARYTANGFLDSTYGINGSTVIDFNPLQTEQPFGGAFQADGKLVVVGFSAMQGTNNTLARLNPNGTLDSTFGTNGTLVFPLGPFDDYGIDIKIQPDGNYVVGGSRVYGGGYNFALARIKPNGTADSTFGTNGITQTDFGYSDDDGIAELYLGSDGKITAVGASGYNNDTDPAAARYKPNGTLDSTFGTNGMLITPVGAGYGHFSGLVVQPDNKILAGGFAQNPLNNDFILIRYKEDGSRDSSFNNNGLVTTPFFNSEDKAWAIKLQPDGKVVLAGATFDGSYTDFALARYFTGITIASCSADTTTLNSNICPGQSFSFNGLQLSVAGIYYDTLSNAGGCDSLIILNLNTYNSPSAGITASGPLTFCEGDSVVLTADTGNTYQWNNGAITSSISVMQSGTYAVTATGSNGCSAVSNALLVTVNPLPAMPVITRSADTLFASLANTYQWFYNGVATSDTAAFMVVSQEGTYAVLISDSNDCVNKSADFTVSGLSVFETEEAPVLLYPNPNNGRFYLQSYSSCKKQAVIINSLGEVVYTVVIDEGVNNIRLPALPEGVYYLTLGNQHLAFSIKH